MTKIKLRIFKSDKYKCLNLCCLIFLKIYITLEFPCLYLFAFPPSSQCKAKELTFSSFMNCSLFSVLNVSGSYFLSLSFLQAIPFPVARKEDPSALGKHHKCVQTNPLFGDHSEWAGPTWCLSCLSSNSHTQSEDHRPGPGWWPQEHSGSQVRICLHPTSKL